jgi:RNA polymerase sigma-70 factor (ECF subfamily)
MLQETIALQGSKLVVDHASAWVEAAFRENHERVFRMVCVMTREQELAADITQEAFVRLLREARAGRWPDNVGGWLYGTASNLVVSRARRVAVARRLAPRLVAPDAGSAPDELAIEHERSRAMRVALGRLSASERMALVMAAEGSSGEEIARHLGKSHAATRTMMSRARARLRLALETAPDRCEPADGTRKWALAVQV